MPGWRKLAGSKGPLEIPPEVAAKLELAHYDRDILYEMSKDEIREHFGYKTTENLRLGPFFCNVIWQFYAQIQAGRPPDFVLKRGFIRGMWYPIKTPMSRHRFSQLKEDRSDAMGKALADLVTYGMCSYKDFQFTDDNQNARVIGEGNPHIILTTEKQGFFGMLRGASELYGCTVLATEG